jgi:hypothetical protein
MSPEILSTLDPGRMARLVALSARARDVFLEYQTEDPDWAGLPGSCAEVEQSFRGSHLPDRSWRPGIVSSIYNLAQLNTSVVVSHIGSLTRLISDESPASAMPAAADAVSRAGIEAAARAWWLLDPTIDLVERTARYMGDMVYSSYEAEEYAATLGHPKSEVALLGLFPTVEAHTGMCSDLGLVVTGARSRRPIINGVARPKSTDLVSALVADTPFRGNRKAVYSMTSGSGHATTFSLLRDYMGTGITRNKSREIVPVLTQEAIDFSLATLLTCYIAVMKRAVVILGWGRIRIDLFDVSVHKTFGET